MPNYKGHLVGGVVAYGLVLYVFYAYCPSAVMAGEWFLCTLAGALFPDVDVKSKGQKYFYWAVLALSVLAGFYKRYDLVLVISFFSVLPMLVRHRGIFHQLWFIVVLAGIAWVIGVSVAPYLGQRLLYDLIFFVLGAFSHLWLDLGLRRAIIP